MLTTDRARQDYVKAIYQLGAGQPVSAAALARYLGVSRAAVTKFRRVLVADGLAARSTARTDRIRLTKLGFDLATAMLRRHRLVETFLHRSLDVPLDVLHEQAEAIEHVISDDVADRLDRFLGYPNADPHGHPIGAQPAKRSARRTKLTDAPDNCSVRIVGIPDRDPVLVRRLMEQGILPGSKARVSRRGDAHIELRSERGSRRRVAAAAAASIDVEIVRGRRA